METESLGSGQVAKLIETSSQYTKVAYSICSQSRFKNQQWVHEQVEQQVDVSLSLTLSHQQIKILKINKD